MEMKSLSLMNENEQQEIPLLPKFPANNARSVRQKRAFPHILCTYAVNSECHRLVSPRQSRNDCLRSIKALNKCIDLSGQKIFLSYLF